MIGFYSIFFKIKNKKFILNLKILMKKFIDLYYVDQNYFWNYIFNLLLKIIIYFVKLIVIFC